MSELIKATKIQSASLERIPDTRESSIALTEELERQKQELQPVIDFYDRLVKGWHYRILRAEKAMKDPGNQSDSQQKVFAELFAVSRLELGKYLPVYNEVKEMQNQLDQRLQEFELMRFKNSVKPSTSTPVTPDFKEARELIYQADALIELRSQA